MILRLMLELGLAQGWGQDRVHTRIGILEYGCVCRTHIHFVGPQSFEKMIEGSDAVVKVSLELVWSRLSQKLWV